MNPRHPRNRMPFRPPPPRHPVVELLVLAVLFTVAGFLVGAIAQMF